MQLSAHGAALIINSTSRPLMPGVRGLRVVKKNGIQFVLAVIPALILASGCSAPCPKPGIREMPHSSEARSNIPKEAVALLRDFITYIYRQEPDLFHDESAQKRFLTAELRKAAAHRWQLYQDYMKKHEMVHSPPSNGTFVGVWEYPSEYLIEGGRQSEKQVSIDILFKWGCPEDNYYRYTMRVSYTFLHEDGTWKLNDAYTHKGEFMSEYSLSEELWRNDHEF
jgi:hypothetical protein